MTTSPKRDAILGANSKICRLAQGAEQHLKRFLDAALPGVCVLCEVHGQQGRDLCEYCHESLSWNHQACRQCAEPLSQTSQRNIPVSAACANCPDHWPITQTLAPLLYQGAARRWVTDLKFKQALVAGRLLGDILADTALLAYPAGNRPQALLPIPLNWRRLIGRGLNQAQVIAAPASRRLNIPIQPNRLKRRYQRQNQHELGRAARLTNLTHSFYAKPGRSNFWNGAHLALVDDVMTTGATAVAAAQACLDAGAGRVDLWCATRTPAPDSYALEV